MLSIKIVAVGAYILIDSLFSQSLFARELDVSKNGFDLSNSSIPIEQIFHGGPPRDGIPSIDQPKFVTSQQAASFLEPDDRVLGISLSGINKAYPVKVLNYHEIVNDKIKEQFISITFCPLCGTGMIFSAKVAGKILTFGVSGLLYNSDVLLYDKQTESLWSQIKSEAITGRYQGNKLKQLPVSHTTWADWQQRYPNSLVLSTDTGYKRRYQQSPYGNYDRLPNIYFPVSAKSNRYHPKELVLGISIKGSYKAFPFVELDKYFSRNNQKILTTQFNQQLIIIHFSPTHRTANVYNENGEEIPTVIAYWFAWYTFYPTTAVFLSE